MPFYFFLAFFSQVVFFQKSAFANSKPLILQLEVSHPRNTDQISLIFRQSTVELVVNTSNWQQDQRSPQLGRFGSTLTPKLNSIKEQIKQIHIQLKKTVPVLSLIKDSRFKPLPSPHTPVLRINDEEIKEGHPYFESSASIIYQIWKIKWTCLDCATYQKKGNRILRILQNLILEIHSKEAETKKFRKKIFSKKRLNCTPKSTGKMECIDPLFGIFEI